MVSIFLLDMSYVLLFALSALCSVPVPVREVSRGEWWSVRTPTVAATATVTRGWNPPSQRAAIRGPALCGTTAFGERWDVITLHHLTYLLWFLTAFPTDSFLSSFLAFWGLRTTLLPVTLTKVRLFAHKHMSQMSLFTLQQLRLGMWPFHKTRGMPSRWEKMLFMSCTWEEWGSDGGSSREWTIVDFIKKQLSLLSKAAEIASPGWS